MSTEPTTTEETAPVQPDGGVAVEPAATPPQEASTTPAQTPATQAEPAAEPAEEDFFGELAREFEDEPADAVVKHVAVADVKALQGKERGIVRAVIARMRERDTTSDAKYAEREAALDKRLKEIEAQGAEMKRQQAALYALATSPELEAARRGQKPKVDPLSPEGMEQLAAYNAMQGVAKALDPIYQRSESLQREQAAAAIAEKYPLTKSAEPEFLDFLAKMNEGIDPADVRAGKASWRVTAEVGARLFTAEKEAAAVKAQAESRRAAEVADRGRAAAAIHRTAAAANAQPDLRIPDEVYAQNRVHEYLNKQSPERRAAMLQYARQQAARA